MHKHAEVCFASERSESSADLSHSLKDSDEQMDDDRTQRQRSERHATTTKRKKKEKKNKKNEELRPARLMCACMRCVARP